MNPFVLSEWVTGNPGLAITGLSLNLSNRICFYTSSRRPRDYLFNSQVDK